jgi:rod shape determining protein RodA
MADEATSHLKARRGRLVTLLGGIDLPLLLVTLALVSYGLVVVYSASLSISEASLPRQAVGVLIGLVLLVLVARFDYRRLADKAKVLFVIDCILMVLPIIPGLSYESHGITGWIKVPFINLTLQTAELAKPVTVLMMAALASRYEGRVTSLRAYLRLCGVLLVPFLLILLQPDLGTGLVILVAGAVVIIMAGPKRSWVLATIAIIVALVAAVLVSDSIVDSLVGDEHSLIKDYQMNRLLVFVNPTADTSGSGYNLQQALIAVGSGGTFGKGIGGATQASLGFLPEAHTDFVFALLSEEFGFVGSSLLVVLFLALILLTLRIANRCESLFGKLVCLGIAATWAFQIFENIGMCLSLMPITGIPLPFISYGSSSMVAQLMCVGIVQSVETHRVKAG